MIKAPKKLIEVALPLDDINAGAEYEKLPGIGPHPRGIHHWWARRPFAAARAILFAQLVNDPGGERGWGKQTGQTIEDAQNEREKLFNIVRGLADWKRSNDKNILQQASKIIFDSWKETCAANGLQGGDLPAFYDPFCGGGAIPFEAQRLGLESHASDINPMAVIINKMMIEIPHRFKGKKSISRSTTDLTLDIPSTVSSPAFYIANDFRHYANIVLKNTKSRIEYLYPKIIISEESLSYRKDLVPYKDKSLKVIAWIWANSVPSPNPAVKIKIPLIRSFKLSAKKNKSKWLVPEIDSDRIKYKVSTEESNFDLSGTVKKSGATCLISRTPISFDHIRKCAKNGNMDQALLCIVAEGDRERLYITPDECNYKQLPPKEKATIPSNTIPDSALGFRIQNYGFKNYSDMFTTRQQVALSTISDEIMKVKDLIIADAECAGMSADNIALCENGSGARAYAETICSYLLLSLGRCIDFNNKFTGWNPSNEKIMHLFGGNKISMVWDFGEANILEEVVGGFPTCVDYQSKCIETLHLNSTGHVSQQNATEQTVAIGKIVSTDPPYYDNIGYACLSDVFYSWLRTPFKEIYPSLFSTISVPKNEELVAEPFRHDGEDNAASFFMTNMITALKKLHSQSSEYYPITLYYAFKQSETKDIGTSSTGWETFLEAIVQAGFTITGTWPLRSEQTTRLRSFGSNALASSILIVCRKRNQNEHTVARKEFLRELKAELPFALQEMIGGKKGSTPIAPVDLAQAAIGPGMAVFSRYSGILEADGSTLSVHNALIQINNVIDEYFNEAEGDMDSNTRFCIDWFMQYGFKESEYGQADVLARAKGATVEGLTAAGVVQSGGGKARLLKFEEYPETWDPEKDNITPTWEALHQLIRALRSGGEEKAGLLLKKMAEKTESIRQLAYRLYTLCERKGWAEEARAYNELIASWHGTVEAAEKVLAMTRKEKHLTLDM